MMTLTIPLYLFDVNVIKAKRCPSDSSDLKKCSFYNYIFHPLRKKKAGTPVTWAVNFTI